MNALLPILCALLSGDVTNRPIVLGPTNTPPAQPLIFTTNTPPNEIINISHVPVRFQIDPTNWVSISIRTNSEISWIDFSATPPNNLNQVGVWITNRVIHVVQPSQTNEIVLQHLSAAPFPTERRTVQK